MDTTCVLPQKSDIIEFNVNKLKLLNYSIARINTIHIGGSEACKANLEVAKGLEAQLLLIKSVRIIFKVNL